MTEQVNGLGQNQAPSGVVDQNAAQSLGWRAALPDEFKEHEYVKTFTKPGDFVRDALGIKTAHDEMKTKMEGAIFKPGKDATAEEQAAYRSAMGIPDTPDGYEFPKGEGVEHDEKTVNWAKDIFHKAALSKDQASTISQAWDGFIQGINKSLQEAEDNALQEVETALKTEWGPDYDKNFELSKRAFKKFANAELSDFKADPILVRAFYEVGKAMGEDSSLTAHPGGGSPPKDGMTYNMPSFG